MERSFEIGIVGAEPAGARAAELLAEAGARVVSWDPRAPWEKPCGGGLTDALFWQIPELKEMLPKTRAVREVRLELDPESGIAVRLDALRRLVSRLDLARWQLDRALRAGATLVKEVVREVRRTPLG